MLDFKCKTCKKDKRNFANSIVIFAFLGICGFIPALVFIFLMRTLNLSSIHLQTFGQMAFMLGMAAGALFLLQNFDKIFCTCGEKVAS